MNFGDICNKITNYFYPNDALLRQIKKDTANYNLEFLGAFKELPTEVLFEILLSLNSLEALGRCAQLNKYFFKLMMDNDSNGLWQSIAEIKGISLPIVVSPLSATNPQGLVRTQIKSTFFACYNAVITLKKEDYCAPLRNTHRFRRREQEEIEKRGAICLTPHNPNSPYLAYRGPICLTSHNPNSPCLAYVGIVLSEDYDYENKDGIKKLSHLYYLHFVPELFQFFTEEDYNKLMPIAIQKLNELKIIPDRACKYKSDSVYHKESEEKTFENFQRWQSKQKKM